MSCGGRICIGGEVRFFSTKLSILRDPVSETTGVTAVERDVTERVRAEQALEDRLALIQRQQEILRIVRAVELLGARCLISGIRPAVAQTMTQLGMGIEKARTFATMRSALKTVMRRQLA
ncbi:hypothetical protein [Sorangium sp. So ce1182]|uniref:hypothetical protein n=1 Tax=Sorangium sp. So ce1182 TaxID=3133334 RepID=UPI003F61A913